MGRKSAKEIVIEWRKDHPYGRECELYNSGILSRASVFRHWKEAYAGTDPIPTSEKILAWHESHPEGTPKECIQETGIPRRTVYYWWKENGLGLKARESEIKVSVQDDGQLFFDF